MTIKVAVSHFASADVQAVLKAGRIAQLPLHPKAAFHLMRVLRKVGEEVTNFESARVAALKKFGREYEENGQLMFEVPREKVGDFTAAMNELAATEVEFTLDKIALADLGDVNLSAQEILALEPFLAE